MPTTGANLTSPFTVADTVFVPNEFTGTITDWASVPWCDADFTNYDNTAADHLNQMHIPVNIARGIGDICSYMGEVDGTTWRIPTIFTYQNI